MPTWRRESGLGKSHGQNSLPDSGSIVRPIRHNGEAYSGINVLMLWSEAIVNGYTSPQWLTFKQAKEYNGNVRKGEHGAMVVYADRFVKTETNANGDEVDRADLCS